MSSLSETNPTSISPSTSGDVSQMWNTPDTQPLRGWSISTMSSTRVPEYAAKTSVLLFNETQKLQEEEEDERKKEKDEKEEKKEFGFNIGCNQSLMKREKPFLNLEPFPNEILRRLNVGEVYRVVERDEELVMPITGFYRCETDGAITYLEEKSEVWAGAKFGTTMWLSSELLGFFSTPVDPSLLQILQEPVEMERTVEVVEAVTGVRYSPSKARTIGRAIGSLVDDGDNHVTLLTAAYCVLFDRLWCEVVQGKRLSGSGIPAEHRHITKESDWGTLWEEFHRPIVVVRNNSKYVNFWTSVCGEGLKFVSIVEAGGKSFVSPWGTPEFKGLQQALIVSEVGPVDGDLGFWEMQEAVDDYVVHLGLFEQAEAAGRLASRLPWLVKNNFVHAMPKPAHSADILRGLQPSKGLLPKKDVTFRLTPQFSIGTLLIAGQLLETRFNHWLWKNLDLNLASASLGAAFRKEFQAWERSSWGSNSVWSLSPEMKEVDEVGTFLSRLYYTRTGDRKFRKPGLNLSFWEAAILGAVPRTCANVVLSAQKPNAEVLGGKVVSVAAEWLAKVRASDLFGKRLLVKPFDDFPFPKARVDAVHLTEFEQRLVTVEKELPSFELVQLQLRRVPISQSLRELVRLFPIFPPGGAMVLGGRFQAEFLRIPEALNETLLYRTDSNVQNTSVEEVEEDGPRYEGDEETKKEKEGIGDVVEDMIPKNWEPLNPLVGGEFVGDYDSTFRTLAEALTATGRSVGLDEVKRVARANGWDEKSCPDSSNLSKLVAEFGVEMTIEQTAAGRFRFRGPKGGSKIPLVRIENDYQKDPRKSEKKRVRFEEYV